MGTGTIILGLVIGVFLASWYLAGIRRLYAEKPILDRIAAYFGLVIGSVISLAGFIGICIFSQKNNPVLFWISGGVFLIGAFVMLVLKWKTIPKKNTDFNIPRFF